MPRKITILASLTLAAAATLILWDGRASNDCEQGSATSSDEVTVPEDAAREAGTEEVIPTRRQLADAEEEEVLEPEPLVFSSGTGEGDRSGFLVGSGTVSTAEGEPVAGAYVSVSFGQSRQAHASTDASGAFAIRDPADHSGDAHWKISKDGSVRERKTAPFGVTGIAITLDASGTLFGTVDLESLAAMNIPAEQAQVRWTPESGDKEVSARVRDDGQWRIIGLALDTGRLVLVHERTRYEISHEHFADLRAKPQQQADLKLLARALRQVVVSLTDEDGGQPLGGRVEASLRSGELLPCAPFASYRNGPLSLLAPPGSRVTLSVPGYEPVEIGTEQPEREVLMRRENAPTGRRSAER